MQQMWGQIAMIGMLAVCTAQDIRRKEIRVNFVLLFGILGIFLHMLFRMLSIGSLLLGMLVGIVLLLLGLASEGRIGTGDGVLLTVTGIYLGPERNLTLCPRPARAQSAPLRGFLGLCRGRAWARRPTLRCRCSNRF